MSQVAIFTGKFKNFQVYTSLLYIVLSLAVLTVLSGCFYKKKITISPVKSDNITVSIHGTQPPVARNLVKAFDSPYGLCPLKDRPNGLILSRMGYVLHETDPIMFPMEDFYLYGWSGLLNISEREQEAEKLYLSLKKLNGKITLIAHSHGGNVSLNLAKIVEKHKDKNFKIKNLILLATPVQEITEKLAESEIFENIISFYSNTDNIQILDPQGIYKEAKEISKNGKIVPLFSKRLFKNNSKIKQIRILINKSNTGHMDFILAKFLRAMPKILKMVEAAKDNNFIVNIDKNSNPEFVKLLKRRDGRKVYVKN